MPKVPINSFNAGELSPYLYARDDLEKYQSGCLTMENCLPLPYGGATRRPAWQYLGEAKDSDEDGDDDRIQLIPFVASVDDSYQLELGTGYLRFWKNGAQIESGGVPVEVGTPYAESDLLSIKVAQSVDVMWFVDGSNAVHRLSRYSDTSWTFEPESFDYPPLLEENDTDITMSPSATTGTITLTASRDFFDAGHVGAYMKFDALRLLDSQTVKGSVSATTISDELYVSSANWSFSTTGTGTGKWTIERSLDSGVTWEEYVIAGDSRGYASAKLFAVSSDGPEPLNTRIRVRFIDGTGTTSYSLVCESLTWESMVRITGYTSATEVTAEVIAEFQDVVSDYSDWATSTSYTIGDKVKVEAGIVYSSTSYDLTSIDADLGEAVGCDFAGGYFWVVTNGVGNIKLWKLDAALTAVESGYPKDLSSTASEVTDIAVYGSYLYITCSSSVFPFGDPRGVIAFTFLGVYFGPVFWTTDDPQGIGYYNNKFYISYSTPPIPSHGYIAQYTTSFVQTGVYDGVSRDYTDVAGDSGQIFACSRSLDRIYGFTESLVLLSATDISSETSDPVGIASDGTDLFVLSGSGVFYKYSYSLSPDTKYYECAVNHTSGSFPTDYAAGKWVDKTPFIKTWAEGAFSDYRGHPKSVAMHEGRLVYGGTEYDPNTFWLSASDDFSNYRVGSLDTDAMKLAMASGQFNSIEWLVSQEVLVVGTSGAEWALGPSDQTKSITPTGYSLKRKSTYGSSGVQGLLINNAVLFPMRQGRKVREWIYQWETKEPAPDLTILSEHVTDSGIESWEFQQQPDNIGWAIRTDGVLIGLTYERDQNVVGWHRHPSSDFIVESVSSIPRSNEEDEVWFSVKITIDGDIKRYICRMNDREWGTDYTTEWQGSDLWVNYQSAGDASHLIGKTVDVVIDGVIKDQEVVDATGSISATLGTNNIVGLPFTNTLAPLYLNADNQYRTSRGSKLAVRKAILKFKDTYSSKAGSSLSDLENVKFDPDAVALYSGDFEVSFSNASDYLKTCYVRQSDPMPWTVLAMAPKVEVQE